MKRSESDSRRLAGTLGYGRRGFTLVELLVVVGIIGVLAGLLLSSLSAAQEKAKSTVCRNNLRQMGLAITMYVSEAHRYPPLLVEVGNRGFSTLTYSRHAQPIIGTGTTNRTRKPGRPVLSGLCRSSRNRTLTAIPNTRYLNR